MIVTRVGQDDNDDDNLVLVFGNKCFEQRDDSIVYPWAIIRTHIESDH